MADKSLIIKVNARVANLDSQHYYQCGVTTALHPSESEQHFVLRILGFILFHRSGLSFSRGICVGNQADVFLKGDMDQIVEWIDAGSRSWQRIKKACQRSQNTVFINVDNNQWLDEIRYKMERFANLSVVTFEPGFVDHLISMLERKLEWNLHLQDGQLFVCDESQCISSPIHIAKRAANFHLAA